MSAGETRVNESECAAENELFTISCDQEENEGEHNFQITINIACVKEKYPIVQGIADFVNKYNTTRIGQERKLFKGKILINALVFFLNVQTLVTEIFFDQNK